MNRPQIASRCHAWPALRFEPRARLTSFAGLIAIMALFKVLSLQQRIKRALRPFDQGDYKLWRIVLILVVHLMLGWSRLRHLDYYRDDPLLPRCLGLKTIPDVSTISRTLATASEQSCEALRQVNRDLVERRLASLQPKEIAVDFDGSVQSTKAHAEGTAVGFNKKKKGARSYYPLFVTIAATGQFYDLLHRPGNVHDSRGAADFAVECCEQLQRVCPRSKVCARLDSAHFNEPTLQRLDEGGFHFSCSVPWRRYPSLKAAAIESEGWAHYEKPDCDVKEIEFKPEKWEDDWRTLLVRQLRKKPLKGPIQFDLFEPVSREYEYSVIVTNRRHRADHVVAYHHGRGYQEKMFAEAKQHAGLGMIVSQHRAANEMHTVCGMLAHNLGREYQMRTDRRRRSAGASLRSLWRFESLGSLAQKVFRQAGRLIRPQGRLTLEVSGNEKRKQRLLRDLRRLQAPV